MLHFEVILVFGSAVNAMVRTYVVDFDEDGQITVNDIASIAVCWSHPIGGACSEIYDLDYDGDIDISDVIKVTARWNQGQRRTSPRCSKPLHPHQRRNRVETAIIKG